MAVPAQRGTPYERIIARKKLISVIAHTAAVGRGASRTHAASSTSELFSSNRLPETPSAPLELFSMYVARPSAEGCARITAVLSTSRPIAASLPRSRAASIEVSPLLGEWGVRLLLLVEGRGWVGWCVVVFVARIRARGWLHGPFESLRVLQRKLLGADGAVSLGISEPLEELLGLAAHPQVEVLGRAAHPRAADDVVRAPIWFWQGTPVHLTARGNGERLKSHDDVRYHITRKA
eukprot:scaffold64160_cov65-Phaeocystis_antarctica.AAC.3